MRSRIRIIRIFLTHSLPMFASILLLSTAIFIFSFTSISQNSQKEAERTFNQMNLYFDNVLSEISALNLMISTNSEISSLLDMTLNTRNLLFSHFQEIKILTNMLSAIVNTRAYIDSIYIYFPNDNDLIFSHTGFTTISSLPTAEWFYTYPQKHPEITTVSERIVIPSQQGDYEEIRICSPVANSFGDRKGIIVFDISQKALINAYQGFRANDEYIMVQNEKGELLFQYPAESQPEKMIRYSFRSSTFGWTYTFSIPTDELYGLSRIILYFTATMMALSLIIGIVLTYFANKSERIFINNVITQLQKAGADVQGISDEDSFKGNTFQYLNNQIIKTFIEKDYLVVQKEAAEYRALQMQINPHFLFNTLTTIYWKTIRLSNGENEASNMIQLLSKMLKYSLTVDTEKGILLKEEINQAERYLEIQKIRFKNMLSIIKDYDSIPNINIPYFTIQPILENCFSHGFIENEALTIMMRITEDDEKYLIVISDDGNPVSQETLDKLNSDEIDPLLASHSIGLRNIKRRIMILTQGKGSLRADSDGERGFSVTIMIRKD